LARLRDIALLVLLALVIGSIADVSASDAERGTLPLLLKEDALSLAAVYNPAAIDLIKIDSKGRVTCEPKQRVARELPKIACRDPRLALSWRSASRYHHDGVHIFGGAIGTTSRVSLEVNDRAAKTWSFDAAKVARGCGHEGFVLQQKTLIIDLSCANDIAVARWVMWKSFLTRECDRTDRSTRAIGPDLRCKIRKDDPNAEVLESGVELIDLQRGTSRSIELE
jgi:hypothetical protein